jgi:hypothetical protein
MFTPDLDLQVVTRCTKFRIIDKTGVDTGDGTKWDGLAGLNRTSVTYAVVRIVAPAGTYYDYDVLSQIPDPVTGEITFADATGTEVDGLHNLAYRIKTTDISISAYANYNGTVANTVRVTTASSHGLETGMYVSIAGSTSYNGEHHVTVIDTTSFYISATFVADDGASTGTKMYIDIFYPYVYCAAEAGIAKMFANRSFMVPGAERDLYTDAANTARGLLESLKSAITSSNVTALDAILAEINQILSINSVDPEI